VGYVAQTIVLKGDAVLQIKLSPDAILLDEVVAIGYGSMKKSDLTGAVGSISGDKLRAAPVARVDQALQGRIAGVTVNSNSGQPGADATIRIRGVGTVNNSDPIYVVDGLITNNINFLSTSDIASISVLKDASAQAIYGARGANGVILITTKKGNNTGKTNLTFESYVGTQNRWKKLDVMGRDEFTNTIAVLGRTKTELDDVGLNEWIRSNYTPNNSTYYPRIIEMNPDGSVMTPGIDYTLYDTDWQDAVFVKDAVMQNYYISADGGTDKSNYMFSANYLDQEGTLIGSYYNRLTLRLNTSFELRKWLRIGENMSFTNSHSRNIQGNGNTALIASALSMAPWDPVVYPEGSLSGYARNKPQEQRDLSGRYSTPSLFRSVMHPYYQVFNTKPANNSDDWVGDIYLEIMPVKGLTIRGDVNAKLWYGQNRSFTPIYDAIYNAITRNGVSASMTHSKQLTYEGTATYNNKFGKHDLTAMIGGTYEEYNSYSVNASGSDLENTDEKNWYIGRTPNVIRQDATGAYYSTRSGGDSVDKALLASFLGRVNYVYDDKYYLTVNFRRDGSGKLPQGKQWETFPSVAAAWRMSEEPFFNPLHSILSDLKVRVGWGQIGNANTLVESDFILEDSDYWYGYPLGSPNSLYVGKGAYAMNPISTWEWTTQTDIGFDFGLWKNLLIGNIDLYRRDTERMIMGIVPPGHVGLLHTPTGNAATVRNQGIEFNLEHQHKIGNVAYSVAGNIAFVNNELTALNEGEPLWDGILLSDEGLPLHTIYVLQYDGVFQNQAEIDAHSWMNPETGATQLIQTDVKPGDARYVDRNNDGQITELDRYNAGNPFPSFTYGFNATVNYKGFDLQLFFQGVAGNDVYNYLGKNKLEANGTSSVLGVSMRDVFYAVPADPNDPGSPWINGMPESNGSIPNPTAMGSTHNSDDSDRFVESAAYLRLKNLQLGYTLPKSLTLKIGVERLRFYVGGGK
jgi:TonB-linked SusC/RagA family outer membrane protein